MVQIKQYDTQWFSHRIRDKALIELENGEQIKRNVYSHYVSNNNPVYIRHNGDLCFVNCRDYNTKKELFYVVLRSTIRDANGGRKNA